MSVNTIRHMCKKRATTLAVTYCTAARNFIKSQRILSVNLTFCWTLFFSARHLFRTCSALTADSTIMLQVYFCYCCFCCYLQRNERIIYLNLSHNEFDEDGAVPLGRAIGKLVTKYAKLALVLCWCKLIMLQV